MEEVSSLLVRLVRVKIGPLNLGLRIAAGIVLINVGIARLRAYEDQLHFIQLAGGSAESTGDMPTSRIPPHLLACACEGRARSIGLEEDILNLWIHPRVLCCHVPSDVTTALLRFARVGHMRLTSTD